MIARGDCAARQTFDVWLYFSLNFYAWPFALMLLNCELFFYFSVSLRVRPLRRAIIRLPVPVPTIF